MGHGRPTTTEMGVVHPAALRLSDRPRVVPQREASVGDTGHRRPTTTEMGVVHPAALRLSDCAQAVPLRLRPEEQR